MDLRSAYIKVRMSTDGSLDAYIAATTFQGFAPNGVSCFLEMLVMEFGPCNVPTTFTRLMNRVLERYIKDFVIVYFNDICIYSDSLEHHIDHLCLMLEKLR